MTYPDKCKKHINPGADTTINPVIINDTHRQRQHSSEHQQPKEHCDHEMDWMVLQSSQLVIASGFMFLAGFVIVPIGIDWYITNIPLPEMVNARGMLEGMKVAGMVIAGTFGSFAFLCGTGWLIISSVFAGIGRLIRCVS